MIKIGWLSSREKGALAGNSWIDVIWQAGLWSLACKAQIILIGTFWPQSNLKRSSFQSIKHKYVSKWTLAGSKAICLPKEGRNPCKTLILAIDRPQSGSAELVDGDDLDNVQNREAMQLLNVLHYSHKSSASNAVPWGFPCNGGSRWNSIRSGWDSKSASVWK